MDWHPVGHVETVDEVPPKPVPYRFPFRIHPKRHRKNDPTKGKNEIKELI